MSITVVSYTHYCVKTVPEYFHQTLEKAVQVMTFQTDLSEGWEAHWQPNYGKLLKVVRMEEEVPDFDPITLEVEDLKKDIVRIQAEAEMGIKEKRDRINDLLQIGYDVGSVREVTVITDVEAKPVTPGEDDGLPF